MKLKAAGEEQEDVADEADGKYCNGLNLNRDKATFSQMREPSPLIPGRDSSAACTQFDHNSPCFDDVILEKKKVRSLTIS